MDFVWSKLKTAAKVDHIEAVYIAPASVFLLLAFSIIYICSHEPKHLESLISIVLEHFLLPIFISYSATSNLIQLAVNKVTMVAVKLMRFRFFPFSI